MASKTKGYSGMLLAVSVVVSAISPESLAGQFEITIAESQIKGSEILYSEDVRVADSDTQFKHLFLLERASDRTTRLRFDRTQTAGEELPQEMQTHILGLLKRNLEALKHVCEKA